MSSKKPIQASYNSFTVLEALLDVEGAGVTQLSRHLDMPKSTVHKHLNTLAELGYVDHSGTTYLPSHRLVSIGERAKWQRPLYSAAKVPINRLAESTEEHAGIYVADGTCGMELYSTRGQRALLDDQDYDVRQDLHCHAAGKAILAHRSNEEITSVIESSLPPYTDETIVEPNELKQELNRIEERGVAFDRSEQYEDIRSIAAPFNIEDTAAAVYVLAPVDRMRGKRFEENIPGLVSSTVRKIETEYLNVHE
jgi:DNA-binding IclR family transcriptional regulator